MQWITSAGGPLALLPCSFIERWHGIADGGHDYALACGVDDYAGIVQWNGGQVLVLNDEPLATTCLAKANVGVFFVRWMYAPDEASIASVIATMDHRLPEPCGELTFECSEREYVLMDAGAPGCSSSERLGVELEVGQHRLSVHVWKPSDDIGLVVCALRLQS